MTGQTERIAQPDRKPTEEYHGFWEYFDAEIAPTLGQAREPQVNIGYAKLKRRP